MYDEQEIHQVLSSERRLGSKSPTDRVLTSGRRLQSVGVLAKRQRTDTSPPRISSRMASRIEVTERTPRENQPSKKLLFQAVTDANKSVSTQSKKSNGVVKVTNPDGTTECFTARTLAKRAKSTDIDRSHPPSSMQINEQNLGHMKIRIRNEYYENSDDQNSDRHRISSKATLNEEEDDDDEFVVVVNSDYDVADDSNNSSWRINDYQNEDDEQQHYSMNADEHKGNGSLKRKFSDDMIEDENELLQQEQYSPQANSSLTTSKKPKRCRFWPDCNNRDQCEFVHPTQRCIRFPDCHYGSECIYIHPNCRFASACSRTECPYFHPLTSNNANVLTSTTLPDTSAIPCKFGLQCMRPNCMYSHPRMSSMRARNLKWVNNKWQAPTDDTPILPPAPTNFISENPFKTVKMPNSNGPSLTN